MIQFDRIDSTHGWAKRHLEELPRDKMSCITAKEQSAGFGRRGTPWCAPKGNLYMTLVFHRPMEERPHAGEWTELLALACIETVDLPLKIKWPNDLFYEGKKCAGILAETVELDGRLGVILSIGLNVNTPVAVDQPTISLTEITGETYEVDLLASRIAARFEEKLQLWNHR